MFKEFIGQPVEVIVRTGAEYSLNYTGVFEEESDKSIKLKNVYIKALSSASAQAMTSKMFGTGMLYMKENVPTVVINKDYIISCNNN